MTIAEYFHFQNYSLPAIDTIDQTIYNKRLFRIRVSLLIQHSVSPPLNPFTIRKPPPGASSAFRGFEQIREQLFR